MFKFKKEISSKKDYIKRVKIRQQIELDELHYKHKIEISELRFKHGIAVKKVRNIHEIEILEGSVMEFK